MLILRAPPTSYSPTNMEVLNCLFTVTSEIQICNYETPTHQQNFGKTRVLKLHYIIMLVLVTCRHTLFGEEEAQKTEISLHFIGESIYISCYLEPVTVLTSLHRLASYSTLVSYSTLASFTAHARGT